MAPLRPYKDWNKRTSDSQEQIEPYRKYFIISEGKNTETTYFRSLESLKKKLKINSLISIICLEKTEEDENASHPLKLIKLAENYKSPKNKFDPKRDKMIIIFDADIFENDSKKFDHIYESGSQNNILGITNPSFELFLLLHYKNSYEELIKPNEKDIINNNYVEGSNKIRFIDFLFRTRSGMNPKKNFKIGELVKDVMIAIEQEKYINRDIKNCKGKITSNIGKIIEQIIEDNYKE